MCDFIIDVNFEDNVSFYSNCSNYHNIYGGVEEEWVVDVGDDEDGVSHSQNVKFFSNKDSCIYSHSFMNFYVDSFPNNLFNILYNFCTIMRLEYQKPRWSRSGINYITLALVKSISMNIFMMLLSNFSKAEVVINLTVDSISPRLLTRFILLPPLSSRPCS